MRLSDIMTTDVATIAPTELAELALTRMKAAHIHHLVVTQGRKLVGMLSERDLGRPGDRSARREKTVSELMTPEPICADPEMPVRRAANILRGRSIGSLPIVKDGNLVGIVTISDLLKLVGTNPLPARNGKRQFAGRDPRPVAKRGTSRPG